MEAFESKHRPGDPLDSPVILLDDIVQVFDSPNDDGRFPFGVDVVTHSQLGRAAIDGHRLGCAVVLNRPVEEAPRGGAVSAGT